MATFIFLPFVILSVAGCGLTTHNLITHRATYYYQSSFPNYTQIISDFKDSVLGGAPFPDYLYLCGTDHDAGEYAHWPPFQAAAATYIRQKPKPWDESTQKLVAFMFGVTSHYVADIIWHGLAQVQPGYGFIENLGSQDYNCSGDLCSDAHSAADTAGEWMAAYQTDLAWFEPEQWYVPVDDLVNIYALANWTVTKVSIEECQKIFITGGLAVRYLSEAVYREVSKPSPFLVEEYISFPLGGVDDMAVWSARLMDRFAEWVENGPPNPPPPQSENYNHTIEFTNLLLDLAPILQQSPLFKEWKIQEDGTLRLPSLREVQNYIERELLDTDSLASLKVQKLSRLITGKPYEKSLKPQQRVESNLTTKSVNAAEAFSYYSDTYLDYLGSSLAVGDLNADGKQELIMGGYGHGKTDSQGQVGIVYIDWSPSHSNASYSVTNTTSQVQNTEAYGRFGWKVQVLDFNLDGIDDLAVSSPTSGNNWTSVAVDPTFLYYGSVQIYFGVKTLQPPFVKPDFIIASLTNYTHFGSCLSVGDIDGDGNNDLIVGNPYARSNQTGENPNDARQRGQVRVYLSNSKRQTGTRVLDESADFTWFGATNFEYFGYSISVVKVKTLSLLLVGAPGYRSILPSGDPITVGRLSAFLVGNQNPSSKAYFTITGDTQQSNTGFSFSSGYPLGRTGDYYLALSAPSTNTYHKDDNDTARAGTVWVISLTGLASNPSGMGYTLNSDSLSNFTRTTLLSAHWGSRFGWSSAFGDVNADGFDDLIISEPLFSEDERVESREKGLVLGWKGGLRFPSGTISDAYASADWQQPGEAFHSRFGSNILLSDITGDKQIDIIISSPRTTNNRTGIPLEFAGVVSVYSSIF